MGMNIHYLNYLHTKGYLSTEKNKILDIGPQNLLNATKDDIINFVRRQGASVPDIVLDKSAERLAYFSTPRQGERTLFLADVTDLTNIEYVAFDVCPEYKTEIIDLNFDKLPECHKERYDLVFNFGTTEHVINQWNSFSLIHDAARVDGIIYHVLPASGFLTHGYFCYTPVFFRDLARANNYDLLDTFWIIAGSDNVSDIADVRADNRLLEPHSVRLTAGWQTVPSFDQHVVLRKTRAAPFKCGLELATSPATVNSAVASRYQSS